MSTFATAYNDRPTSAIGALADRRVFAPKRTGRLWQPRRAECPRLGGKRTLGHPFRPDAKLAGFGGRGGCDVSDRSSVESEHGHQKEMKLRHTGAIGLDVA